jgi:uncharacterized protein (DUF927 family)
MEGDAVNDSVKDMVNTAANAEPENVTSFPYGGGRFEILDNGVFFIAKDNDGIDKAPFRVCSRLNVLAQTRNDKQKGWGRYTEWQDNDGHLHKWSIPLALLSGDGVEVFKELADRGLTIPPVKKARDLLAAYIQSCPIPARALCVDRLGWYRGRFVMPDQIIGQANGQTENRERIVFQSSHAIEPAFSVSGTPEQWRENVAAYAAGNSRLLFAVSAAFAGALLDVADGESGGFHLHGDSSTGKSTAQLMAAGVWGKPKEYKRSWRATGNGLEGAAMIHNDGILILDEIKECNPHEISDTVYMLGNGQGKTRAKASGDAKKAADWNLIFLSSGEKTLSDITAEAGQRPNAGAEVRFAEIPADAGAGYGLFENIHGCKDSREFAETFLPERFNKYYGAAGVEFLRLLVEKRGEMENQIKTAVNNFVAELQIERASWQASRVARRFGLVAVAGELATDFGITGWSPGAAKEAAKTCFRAWLENFGTGDREKAQLLSQVKAFFEAHGTSRFQDMTTPNDKIINRAGFYKTEGGLGIETERKYYVYPEAFKEICKGFNSKTATKILIAAGWLEPGSDGNPTQKPYISTTGERPRLYVFGKKLWEENVPSD